MDKFQVEKMDKSLQLHMAKVPITSTLRHTSTQTPLAEGAVLVVLL